MLTLLTDFGTQDTYVGIMKGVILGINPGATLVDLTHQVAPQDIPQGAFLLGYAAPYFPAEAIHLAVVDPGVGSARRALAVQGPSGTFVAPDNGLLTYALDLAPVGDAPGGNGAEGSETHTPSPGSLPVREVPLPAGWRAVALENPEFWRHPVSRTFHGRDIFAPVAAHLSLGVPLEQFGPPVTSLLALEVPRPCRTADGALVGRVIAVDHFGNLLTNLTPELLPAAGAPTFEVAGRRIAGLSQTYADGGELVAVVGSTGRVEIAVRNGSARSRLGVGVGARVTVRPGGSPR
ncbi:MAG: SAM-dependent chlorinase/fluorinase [Chloroflexi bacterium]|nr:SAM-dependent chlorinase/fluorinase [Chloroflexota bacterium]